MTKLNQIENDMKLYHVLGCAIYDQRESYFGNVCDTTIFEAASLTKVVFAYIVAKMMKEKRIDYDKTLESYGFVFEKCQDERAKGITVRQVLSHSTGFENWPKDEFILHFQPGTKFRYSGAGYEGLQYTVEKLTNQSIRELFSEYVFKPLNMKHSYLCFENQFANRMSPCYDECGNEQTSWRRIAKPNVAYTLYTTLSDYKKFADELMKCKAEGQLQDMFRATTKINDNLSWGCGLANIKDRYYWQWGDNGCFKNFFFIDAIQNRYILYFSNSKQGLHVIMNYLNDYKEISIVSDFIKNHD